MISDINNVVEATLINYKVFKHHDRKTTVLKLEDSAGELIGVFNNEYNDLSKNSIYKIKGKIIDIKDIDEDYKFFRIEK